MKKYILKNENKTVIFAKLDEEWNYKKELGTTLIDNFNVKNSEALTFFLELLKFNYKIVEKPSSVLEVVNGNSFWLLDNVIHREDGPAIERVHKYYGGKEWLLFGKLHRDNGPAIEDDGGSKFWYNNGKLHRDDGPAVIFTDGREEWWQNGNLHRKDGPAIIDGDYSEYWVDGVCVRGI